MSDCEPLDLLGALQRSLARSRGPIQQLPAWQPPAGKVLVIPDMDIEVGNVAAPRHGCPTHSTDTSLYPYSLRCTACERVWTYRRADWPPR